MSNGRYRVLDLETTVRNKGDVVQGGGFEASPFHPHNIIVRAGWKDEGVGKVLCGNKFQVPDLPDDITLLVGQNIAFDLEYMLMGHLKNFKRDTLPEVIDADNYLNWWNWFYSGGLIWDTMIAQYILTGQHQKWANLDALSKEYGGTQKDDKIKAYWEAGVPTEDIPDAELVAYLYHDVRNTEIVFLAQLERAEEQGQLALIMQMMEARMATIEMELNGTYLDRDGCKTASLVLEKEITELSTEAQHKVDAHVDPNVNVAVGSSQQMSKFFFGGEIKSTVEEVVLDEAGNPARYKGGKRKGEVKTRKATVTHTLDKIPGISAGMMTTRNKNGSWRLDDDVLKKLELHFQLGSVGGGSGIPDPVSHDLYELVVLLREIRKKEKDLSAFYKPYVKLCWYDGLLHPSYQHVSTDTSRLSCIKPNMQQASGGD